MEKLRQDIKNGTFESVYLLYGEETYLVRSYKDQLKRAIIGDDRMNYACFEGKGISLDEVADLAGTLPFFADRRLILLEDTGLFKAAVSDGWVSFVKEIPESCHLIFAEREVDKRGRLYKAVKDCGYCVQMQRQSQKDLERWVVNGFWKNGLKITQDALDLFLQKTGDDMENIRMEMDKLSGYCMGKEGITAEDVEEICTQRLENRVFDMTQAVAEGKQKKALELYYDLLALKESEMKILFLIARQMNQLLCVRELMGTGMGKDGIAAKMKLHPFVAGKLIGQARQFTAEQLRSCVEQCVSLEEAVKSGNMNGRIAVEMLLTAISSGRIEKQG